MRAILAVLLCCAVVQADVKTIKAGPGQLVVIALQKPARIQVLKPFELVVKTFELKDGSWVVVFSTGRHKQIVMDCWVNGEVIPEPADRYIIAVVGPQPPPGPEPEPDPDPDPEPVLSGLAKQIYQMATKAKVKRTSAHGLAANYEGIATRLAAVSSFTIAQAAVELRRLNQATTRKHPMPRAAQSLEKAIERALREIGSDRDKLIDSLNAIAQGYWAI